ncbi:hypothetical protein QTP88_021326 [Uroleucon formosanum]
MISSRPKKAKLNDDLIKQILEIDNYSSNSSEFSDFEDTDEDATYNPNSSESDVESDVEEIFKLFFTSEIIDLIVIETNRNDEQFLSKNRLTKSSRFAKWIPINENEIQQFSGLIIRMGLVQMPALKDYWCNSTSACSNELQDWLNKKKSSTPFAIPMVWREQKNYHNDCYFCNVNGFSKKNKHTINYPNLDFAIRPVKHSASLPIPIPPEEGLNLNIEMECDQDSSDHHDECPEDADYTPDEDKSYLQTFSQDELNDLIRDLSLSKEKAEFLASRLKQKNLL